MSPRKKHLDCFFPSHVTCGRKFFTKHFKELPPSFERCFMSFWCSTGMLWKWKHGVKSQRCKLQFQPANKEEKQNRTRRINVWLMYNLAYFYQQINKQTQTCAGIHIYHTRIISEHKKTNVYTNQQPTTTKLNSYGRSELTGFRSKEILHHLWCTTAYE